MELTEFRALLESDITWRSDELRFFKNQIENIVKENDKDIYRKSLVLILYSHFEGFTKLALETYVEYINKLNLNISDVTPYLKAASLNKEFESYDKLEKKSEIFKKDLPEDKVIHRAARRIEFIEVFDEFLAKKCIIPDNIIDTESNLKYKVLRKNLYQIGLDIESLQGYESYISQMLGKRNAIAHGSMKSGITESDYINFENNHTQLIGAIRDTVYDYARNQKYLCNTSL